MNIQAFSERFIKICEDMDATGLSWDDETSYFSFHSHLEEIVDMLKQASDTEKGLVFNNEVVELTSKMDAYKQDLQKLPSLSENQINRIMLMNRLDFLFFQQIKKMPINIDTVHFTLADKLLQAALVTGLNGPQHRKYLQMLLDKNTLTNAVSYLSKTRPFVEKYGKSVSDKDKRMVSELSPAEILAFWGRSLGETPTSIIKQVPAYKDILD